MEETSKDMKSDSAITTTTTTTTTEFCESSRIKDLHPLLRQKQPSPIQFKDDIVQASGHRDDAHMDERDQALCPGIYYRSKKERIPDNKRIHELSENHSPSNIPSKKFRSSESNPQDLQMPKVVLNMANNESHKLMPAKFLMTDQAHNVESKITAGPSMDHSEDDRIVVHKLFEKSLTPSDAGKLNRFVAPKKNAPDCFPDVKNTDKMVLLEFIDNQKKRWKFRYSYRTSSQTFVLTKGWSRFVKEKGLDENDVVVFYRFEEKQDGHTDQYHMIDIIPSDNGSGEVILREHVDEMIENQKSECNSDTTEKSMAEKMEEGIPKNILTRGHEGVEEAAENSSAGERDVMKVEDKDRDKMSVITSQETNLEENSLQGKEQVEATDMKQERFKEGVWLFGVQISP